MPAPPWSRPVHYAGEEFVYRRCSACRSLVCDPMPGADTLRVMYGGAYATLPAADLVIDDPRGDDWVVERVGQAPPGLFVDYGCGGGALLARVAATGREVHGVELDPDVAAEVAARTGLPVSAVDELAADEWAGRAEVLHFGDVLEHLPDPGVDLGAALRLLRSGGTLLAQGPLEGNRSLFHAGVRLVGRLRQGRPTSFPPYHVQLATAAGQQALFRSTGLAEVEWRVTEVSWPAPSRLRRSDLAHPRPVALFGLRRASQAASAVLPGDWGNRYVYRGRRP
jgi:SAM-dependent methyltransferase